MNLSDNLKRIRKENNLSQEQLADKLNVSRQSVSKWESGSAYPEMDKVLQLCKMFDLSMDELLNQDIKKTREEKNSKIDINKYIESFLKYITKTVDMFTSMKLSQILKCLIEQAFIAFILFIACSIIYGVCGIFFNGILEAVNYNSIMLCIFNIGEVILVAILFILAIIIMLHIFKTRYLDYYTIVKDDKEEYIESTEEKITNIKSEKIIIRDPKHGEYGFINGLLKFILICIKCFAGFIAIGFCFSFVSLIVALVLSFMVIKTGVTFIGIFLAILGSAAINLTILYLLYNFIVSKKNNLKLVFISFISSLILIGVGIGLFMITIKDYKVITDYSHKETSLIEMKDNLVIHHGYLPEKVNYIEEDRNDVKVVLEDAGYASINIDYYDNNNFYIADLYYNYTDNINLEIMRKTINSINNKKLVDYSNFKVTIYASKENIKILKDNYYKWNNDCYHYEDY